MDYWVCVFVCLFVCSALFEISAISPCFEFFDKFTQKADFAIKEKPPKVAFLRVQYIFHHAVISLQRMKNFFRLLPQSF